MNIQQNTKSPLVMSIETRRFVLIYKKNEAKNLVGLSLSWEKFYLFY
jgi:hypothetical protein